MTKSYFLKIFDVTGATILETIPAERMKSDPNFKMQTNSGQGVVKYELDKPFLDFGEGSVIDHEHIVECYLVSDEYPTGTLVHKGVVMDYDSYTEEGAEGLQITCLGLVSLATYAKYQDANYTVSHAAQDPANIFKAIIDNYQSVHGNTLLSYTVDSIDLVGTAVSIDLIEQTHLASLEAVFALISEEGWYFYIDQNGVVYLKQFEATPTHRFTLNKDVVSMHLIKSSKTLVNKAVVSWSGGSQSATDAGSIALYRLREKLVQDGNVTDATSALARAQQETETNGAPTNRFEIEVNSLYDIDSIRPGHTCTVANFLDEDDVVPGVLRIAGVSYKPERVILEIEQVNSNLGEAVSSL